MADEDDKIRRNLVVVSSAVLASSYLGMPFAAIWEKIMGPTKAMVLPQPHELIVCGLVVLLYLALRYRFSIEGEHYINQRKEEMDLLHWMYVERLVRSQGRTYVSTGRDTRILFPDLPDIRGVVLQDIADHHKLTIVEFDTFHAFVIDKKKDGWRGRVSISLSWRAGANNGALEGAATHFIVVSRIDRLYVKARTLAAATFYSKSAISVLFPVFLGLGASAVLGWKVYQLYQAAAAL